VTTVICRASYLRQMNRAIKSLDR